MVTKKALTQVSNEDLDPIVLAHELESTWRIVTQRDFTIRDLQASLTNADKFASQKRPKIRAFSEIARVINDLDPDDEASHAAGILLIRGIIKQANLAVELVTEAQTKGAK